MSAVEGGLTVCPDLGRGVEVDRGGGVHADPGVAVFVVVGGEEPLAEPAGIGEGAEPVREVGHVLEGLELGLGVRVVIRALGRECERQTPRNGPEEDDSWERELATFATALSDGPAEGLCGIDDALDVMQLVGMVYDAALVAGDWSVGVHRHVDAISSYRARLGRMMTIVAWDQLEELSRLCLAAHDRGRTIWVDVEP